MAAFRLVLLALCVSPAHGLVQWLLNLFNRQPSPCIPIDTVNNATFELSLDEYTRATWYVQKQQPTEYQALSQLYCVTATYNLEGRTVPFFGGTVVTVYNQGTGADLVGAVNSGGAICARVKDASQPDKLYVAPCFLPNALAGPYWPIYLETNSDGEYTLVVVSGGQPDVVLQEDPPICTTSEQGTNDSGMWILARDAEADPAAIARAEAAMLSMGVGTSELVTVTQGAGCAAAYADRFIKPRDCATPGKCNPSSAAGSCSNFNGFIGGLLCKIFITVFSICI